MRFTAFFAVALATVVQVGVASAGVLGAFKRQEDSGAVSIMCLTTNSTTCGVGSTCVPAPNSVVPTLGVSHFSAIERVDNQDAHRVIADMPVTRPRSHLPCKHAMCLLASIREYLQCTASS